MKKINTSHILFYLLSALIFFFLGMVFAGITGAGKNQGLAGGAIVLGYGVMSGVIVFILAIVLARYLKNELIVLINKIYAALLIIFLLFSIYRYNTNRSDLNPDNQPQKTKVTTSSVSMISAPQALNSNKPPMGLGMAKPNFHDLHVLYFYNNPNLEKSISDHLPTDSLVFKRTERGIEISYAPPWFAPAHLKLDYDILYLRIISIQSGFIEVLVNEYNGQKSYLSKTNCQIKFWPEFLLTINSIEPLQPQNNLIRIKPLSHAAPINMQEYAFLKVLRISNQWAYVEQFDDGFKSLGKGWVKWRENGQLIVSYSLLS
ncbi:MAG: hypothetical protein D8M58_20275 [Calditrichaeota bacterium]|nr:MAG: hypothetical protein DWQ03_14260 [Calditrichota bacterium]MBL1207748.1 hypothetical protein [Calditrichota bacterium]NOG47582.1 hypothetical protein [Calditrichota bacterium]